MEDLAGVVDAFASLRVVVVGDLILDVYLDGTATRLCREAPVPVVRVERRTARPGGAANAAGNLRSLGASVDVVGVVGEDGEGDALTGLLRERGVGTANVVSVRGRETLVLRRLRAAGQLLARFDDGTVDGIGPEVDRALVAALERTVPGADAVLVSDYGHGVFRRGVRGALARLQRSAPTILVVDSRHPEAFRSLRPTAVKPNWAEALGVLGHGELDGVEERADGIAAHGDRLIELTGADLVAVTLDHDGAIVFERDRPPHRTYARRSSDDRATGAGDTFVSALTLALAAGASTPAAAELASAAAAVVVDADGTSAATARAVVDYAAGSRKVIRDHGVLRSIVEGHRAAGRRVAFTNGCFDLLHRGHITYLDRAKTVGDVLVVGVNDDDSVRRLKGETRPINGVDDRMGVLAALSAVDYVVPFAGESPARLLELVCPDVYVKGGDYTIETLPEAGLVSQLGIRVRFLPFMHDHSTTRMLERVRVRTAAQSR